MLLRQLGSLLGLLALVGLAAAPRSVSTANGIPALDLAYEGAFRLPDGSSDASSFEFGGTALHFDAARRSLWLVGHAHHQRIAEISIPEIRSADDKDALQIAHLITPFRDVLAGKRTEVGSDESRIGGILRTSAGTIVSAWIYYDALGGQSRSHFRVTEQGNVLGPYQIGHTPGRAGFVAGYMIDIPPDWRTRLGGTALTGQCCIPIISRTSFGPALTAFTPGMLGADSAGAPVELLGYPADHPTLGDYDSNDGLFNGATEVGGVVFPEGTSTIIFFGRIGIGEFCYGEGTDDPNLHERPVPGGGGNVYCYDPIYSDQGTHGYPYSSFYWAYDARDLVDVREGRRQPWEVVPYASGRFTLPFQREFHGIDGAAYDAATQRIFLSARYQDGAKPIIHVLRLDGLPPIPSGPSLPPTVPAPGGRHHSGDPVGRAIPRVESDVP